MVAESLPLLLLEALAEDLDELVQFVGVAAQELPHIFQALQAVRGRGQRWRRLRLRLAGVHLHWPGDAQDAVALLLLVVEGLLKQDGDGGRGREAGAQQDLPVLDPDILQRETHPSGERVSGITFGVAVCDVTKRSNPSPRLVTTPPASALSLLFVTSNC